MIDYALAMRPFSVFRKLFGGKVPPPRHTELHGPRADPPRSHLRRLPIFTAWASPAMNWHAVVLRFEPIPCRSFSTSTCRNDRFR